MNAVVSGGRVLAFWNQCVPLPFIAMIRYGFTLFHQTAIRTGNKMNGLLIFILVGMVFKPF